MRLLLVALVLAGVRVAAAPVISPLEAVGWPGVAGAYQHGRIVVMSHPDAAALDRAKEKGIQIVVDLNTSSEGPLARYLGWIDTWDEGRRVRARGMRYVSMPLSVSAPDIAVAQRYLQFLRENGDKNIIVHCDLGGRALTMHAIYLGVMKGYSAEDALAIVKGHGLKHEALERYVLDSIRRLRPAAPAPQAS